MATNIRRRVASMPSASSSENAHDENCSPKAAVAVVASSHGATNGKVTAAATARGGCTRRAFGSIGNGVVASRRRDVASQDYALPKHSPSLTTAAAPFVIYEEADVHAEVIAAPSASADVSRESRGHDPTTALRAVYQTTLSLPASLDASAASPMILDSSWATSDNCSCQDMCGVEVNKETVHDPLVLSEYSVHIYIYMCKAEARYRPRANYMSRQQDVSHAMRAVLVDWLSEVVTQYGLQRETLHLAVGYSDRFLSRMSVTRDKLQLLGAAALYVASTEERFVAVEEGSKVYEMCSEVEIEVPGGGSGENVPDIGGTLSYEQVEESQESLAPEENLDADVVGMGSTEVQGLQKDLPQETHPAKAFEATEDDCTMSGETENVVTGTALVKYVHAGEDVVEFVHTDGSKEDPFPMEHLQAGETCLRSEEMDISQAQLTLEMHRKAEDAVCYGEMENVKEDKAEVKDPHAGEVFYTTNNTENSQTEPAPLYLYTEEVAMESGEVQDFQKALVPLKDCQAEQHCLIAGEMENLQAELAAGDPQTGGAGTASKDFKDLEQASTVEEDLWAGKNSFRPEEVQQDAGVAPEAGGSYIGPEDFSIGEAGQQSAQLLVKINIYSGNGNNGSAPRAFAERSYIEETEKVDAGEMVSIDSSSLSFQSELAGSSVGCKVKTRKCVKCTGNFAFSGHLERRCTDRHLCTCETFRKDLKRPRNLAWHRKSHLMTSSPSFETHGKELPESHKKSDRGKKMLACAKELGIKSSLVSQLRIHIGEWPLKCSHCGKGFMIPSVLKIHERTHTGERPYVCAVCGKAFAQRSTLGSHAATHSTTQAFVCEECGKSFARATGLAAHRRTHTGGWRLECGFCGKGFSNAALLKTHERKHTGERPFECDACGKGFKTKGTLKEHGLTHTGERGHACAQCGRRFSQRSAMKRHLLTHSGERPYVCAECGRSFRQSRSLAVHRRTHTGERPYPCDECGKRFRASKTLVKHRRLHARGSSFALVERQGEAVVPEHMARSEEEELFSHPDHT